jgi:hypothetical protein
MPSSHAIFILSLVGGMLFLASVSIAQQVCVLAPNGEVVCGPLVQRGPQPGYIPPSPEPYYEPGPYFDERGYRVERRPDEPRRNPPPPLHAPPAHPPIHCQPGFTVQGGVCKPGH